MNKVKSCFKNNFIKSLIVSLILYFITVLLSGFHPVYSENDDFALSYILSKGQENSLFINYFLSYPIVKLQNMFLDINVWTIFLVFVGYISIVTINYFFLEKMSFKKAFPIILFTNIFIAPTLFILLQWTHISTISGVAGVFCILNVSKYNKRKKIILSFSGIFLCLLSSMIRFKAFLLAFFIAIIFCIVECFVYVLKNSKYKKKKLILGEIINNRLTLLLLIFAFILPYGLNAYSNSIKLSNPDFNWEYQYNFYRSSISDYQIPLYEGNEEFYNSIDINSQNDLNYFTFWNGDKEFFTVEKLKIITDYAKETGCKTADPTYIIKVIVNKFFKIAEKLGTLFVCALVVFLVFGILLIVYLYKNKYKLKRYFLVFSILFNLIPIIAISIILKVLDIIPMSALIILLGYIIATMFVTIFFDKLTSLKIVFFSAITISLLVYLCLSRINFRSLYSVIIPMFFVILYQIDFKKLNSFGKKLCQKNTLKVLVYSLFLCVSLIMSISLMAQFNVYERNEKANDYSLYNYMQNNKDNFYVVASEVDIAIRTNYDNPFLIPEQPDNVVLLGGWLSTNIYEIKKAEKYDVKWICKDLIEKENVYLVVSKKTTNTLQSLIGQYINDHYANENETINFNIIKTFGNNCICEVFKS